MNGSSIVVNMLPIPVPPSTQRAVQIFSVTFSIFGIILNGLGLRVLLRIDQSKAHNITYILLLVADLLACVGMVFHMASRLGHPEKHGLFAYMVVTVATINRNQWVAVMICSRCIVTFKSQWFDRALDHRRQACLFSTLLSASVIFAIICTVLFRIFAGTPKYLHILIAIFIIQAGIPVPATLTAAILTYIWENRKVYSAEGVPRLSRLLSNHSDVPNRRAMELPIRTPRTILTIAVIFFLLQFPGFAVFSMYYARTPFKYMFYAFEIHNVALTLNSVVHVVVLFVGNGRIRRGALLVANSKWMSSTSADNEEMRPMA